ncbi:septation protein SepH [Bifidobacterium avesanii]|uniref:DUF3071 domain-containing protein n=1 Tax=Bifidobacterium avesanii TaxID=1798157 RepID=A0A7K3TKI1_9BIFI|nr:septation protein SepH [Bifidobacterium avesanii]KAB8288515.1 hypothetical protein DSM100685_1723 [Bifidobacterium avesanii]NEG79239.1 DUF3071 domain-containing protein [Bifidobacterium avesanii]
MPDDQLREARFDHVNEQGDLVFEALNRHFTVRVTDALERGILEAKQVKAELEGTPQPQAAAALPISQIQSLIRAGSSTAQVAQQFNVSEALVRRFAAPVETEKKYAIDQFLSMGAGKASRNQQSNADLIAEALETARIDMDSLNWKATRRGHEPWRIEATFESASRTLRADWSWNMRDNTVVSLNSIAKRLLGETAAPAPGVLDDRPAARGTSMDGRPVAFWTDAAAATVAPEPTGATQAAEPTGTEKTAGARNVADAPADDGGAAQAASGAGDGAGASAAAERAADSTSSAASAVNESGHDASNDAGSPETAGSSDHAEAAQDGAAGTSGAAAGTRSTHGASSADESRTRAGNPMTAWLYGGKRHESSHGTAQSTAASASARQSGQSGQPGQPGQSAPQNPAQSPAKPDAQAQVRQQEPSAAQPAAPAKRKSTRSAVPSWDEILFGE